MKNITDKNHIQDDNEGEYRFADLFDLSEIQKIQDAFSRATGVASIITEVDGTPITRPSNFCRLCFDLIRKSEAGAKNCMLSDSVIGKPKKDGPRVQQCLSGGLLDGGASIMVGDRHIANWMVGQIFASECDMEEMLDYADVIGVDRKTYANELKNAKHMPRKQFDDICELLFLIAQQLSNLAIKNLMQSKEIARRKQAEHEIIDLNEKLEIKVLQRTNELQGINALLKEKIFEKEQIQKKLEKYQLLAENANDAMLFTDMEGNITEVNDAAIKIYGYSREEFTSMKVSRLRYFDEAPHPVEEIYRSYENGTRYETVHYRKNGTAVNVDVNSQGTMLDGKKLFLSIIRDITERKKSEDEIAYLGYHDKLTGLYNRRFYEEELNRIDTKRNLPITIVMGDVNGLKLINDSFGHSEGDELLIKAAQVIKQGCRADDIIARLGGDEFIILLPKTGPAEAEKIIERIKKLAASVTAFSISLSISFGYETKKEESEDIRIVSKRAEDYMYRKKIFESQSMRGNTISAIITALYEKNSREELHANKVSELCERMGMALGLPDHEVMELKTVGLFHDIGKIAVDEKILSKTGELTESEWDEVKRHSETGYRILSTTNDMSDIAEYVLDHHERWDGSGYPKGLKGKEIPFISRIIAIADAYAAMTSESCYQRTFSKEEALRILQKNAGIKYDPELVVVFAEKVL